MQRKNAEPRNSSRALSTRFPAERRENWQQSPIIHQISGDANCNLRAFCFDTRPYSGDVFYRMYTVRIHCYFRLIATFCEV